MKVITAIVEVLLVICLAGMVFVSGMFIGAADTEAKTVLEDYYKSRWWSASDRKTYKELFEDRDCIVIPTLDVNKTQFNIIYVDRFEFARLTID